MARPAKTFDRVMRGRGGIAFRCKAIMPHYAIVVFWSEEDGAWVADVPDLKSCSAFGATPEEAVVEVRVAMEAWLASARKAGHPIPEALSAAP